MRLASNGRIYYGFFYTDSKNIPIVQNAIWRGSLQTCHSLLGNFQVEVVPSLEILHLTSSLQQNRCDQMYSYYSSKCVNVFFNGLQRQGNILPIDNDNGSIWLRRALVESLVCALSNSSKSTQGGKFIQISLWTNVRSKHEYKTKKTKLATINTTTLSPC